MLCFLTRSSRCWTLSGCHSSSFQCLYDPATVLHWHRLAVAKLREQSGFNYPTPTAGSTATCFYDTFCPILIFIAIYFIGIILPTEEGYINNITSASNFYTTHLIFTPIHPIFQFEYYIMLIFTCLLRFSIKLCVRLI